MSNDVSDTVTLYSDS